MAQIREFESTTESYFILDGVSYPKVYEAMLDNGYSDTKIKLVGTNRDTTPLVFSTQYTNIRVDGDSFDTALEAISRLNQIVFSKGGGSGGGGTTNVITEDSDTVAFTGNGTAENPLSAESVGGGTTGVSYIEITKSELDSHIINSTLKSGVLYGIKETERWMLLGDSTDTLYLRAISVNQLETKGIGRFFVPKYDKNIDGYGIWQGEVYEAFPTTVPEPTYAINDRVIWGGRLWKNLSGLLGTKIDIYNLSEDWEIIPFNETDYNVRFDKVEYDYQNDMIIYRKDDNGNEISTSYQDWYFKENNSFDGNPLNISLWNSLKIYQWGNEFDYNSYKGCGFNIVTNSILECLNTCGQIFSNTVNNGYIFSNTVNNGYIFSNTLNNGNISSNTLENNGNINSNTLNNGNINSNTLNNGNINSNTLNNGNINSNTLNNGYISSNTLNNGNISYNTLENNGNINSNTLNNGNISYNTLENNGQIYSNTVNNGNIRLGLANTINNKIIKYLTINNGDIGGIAGIDLSSATLIYADYTREVFKNSAGVTKIKYVNGSDVTVIANLTD